MDEKAGFESAIISCKINNHRDYHVMSILQLFSLLTLPATVIPITSTILRNSIIFHGSGSLSSNIPYEDPLPIGNVRLVISINKNDDHRNILNCMICGNFPRGF